MLLNAAIVQLQYKMYLLIYCFFITSWNKMGKITPDFIRLSIRTTIFLVRNTVGCIQNDVDKNKYL